MSSNANPDKRLRVVDTALPEPPYHCFVRANGYHCPMDTEVLLASSTWRLAPEEIKNALLRLWIEAWAQIPIGSLPCDDLEIAVLSGLPLIAFQTHRSVLMRGWSRHSDSRLYHKYITGIVLEMLAGRRSHAARVAKWREKEKQGLAGNVTHHKPATDASVTALDVDVDVDVDRNVKPNSKSKTRRATPSAVALPAWMPERAWLDFVDFRKAKRSPMTIRAQELVIAKLDAMRGGGDDPKTILEQSLCNGWTSLRPTKEPQTQRGGAQWWTSEATILANGAELGLAPRPGESIMDFRRRINVLMSNPSTRQGKLAATAAAIYAPPPWLPPINSTAERLATDDEREPQ